MAVVKCPCGRGRVHGDTGQCRLCWQEELTPLHTTETYPDNAQYGNHGIQVDSRVGRRAFVAEGVTLGAVRIHDFAMVGSRPFEFVKDAHGNLRGFPRTGSAVLHDDVEVFPFANIDAGFLGDTIIYSGTKIDHHVHVGHNSVVGRGVLLCAGSIIGGHCIIGDGAFIGLNAVLKPRVRVGEGAVIGMGAIVIDDVPAGETWAGNPARKIK